eukprot:1464760-Karenia_brevis.AAC.1
MEQGLDLTLTTKHYNCYIKHRKMCQAGAIMAVFIGALWPGDGLELGDDIHKCALCQEAGYDEIHPLPAPGSSLTNTP